MPGGGRSMATGPIETHLHRSFNWENGAPGPQEGPRGRSANCGNGLSAQCVRLRSEITPTPARLVRYSSHYSTSTEHSTANVKGHAIGRSPVPNNTGRTLSFLYVIASYIILSDNIASYNVIRQAAHAKGAVHHRTWPVPEAPDRSGLALHGAHRTFRGTQAAFEAQKEGSTPLRH